MTMRWLPTEARWLLGFAFGASALDGDLRAVLYLGKRKVQFLRGEIDEIQPPADRRIQCPTCGYTPHRWMPSPEAGPYRRCSERGEPAIQRKDPGLAQLAWMAEHPTKCPCESDLDDPGPHIDTCPWADPEYDGGD